MRFAGTEVDSFASSDLHMLTLGDGPSGAVNNGDLNSAAKKSLVSEQIPTKLLPADDDEFQ